MPPELRKWNATRRQGMAKFILQFGVLAWGLPMFAIMTFVVNRRAGEVRSPQMILVSIVLWALGGALYGWTMWTITEKKYQKYLAGLEGQAKV
jgi:uncharacterized membrane protein